MLSQYGQEKFDRYKDDFSSSPLELCSYCQKSIALIIDVGRSCGAAVITVTAAPATATAAAAGDAMGTAGSRRPLCVRQIGRGTERRPCLW